MEGKSVNAERKFTGNRMKTIIELKKKAFSDEETEFVVINEKGVDPFSLDALAIEDIVALNRVKGVKWRG